MAGLLTSHVLVVFCAFVAFDCVSTLPRDIPFPEGEGNHLQNSESIAYPASVNNQLFKIPEEEDKPKSCFHFYVSRNMSSLLAEATKMLQTIRDRREREWILTFIYRIKSLAEHLRAHPESRNYDCLPTDEDTKRRIVSDSVKGQQQPELYFVDDVSKRSDEGEEVLEKIDETNSNDNQEPNNTSVAVEQSKSQTLQKKEPEPKLPSLQTQSAVETASDNTLTESTDEQKDISTSKQDGPPTNRESAQKSTPPIEREKPDDSSIILSSAPDCDSNEECKRGQDFSSSRNSPENYFADAGNINPMYQSDDARDQDFKAAEAYRQEVLKARIRKALLEELAPEFKKLKTVGGTEEDLMSIWNSRYVQEDKSMEGNELADFDYEETGAAAGDLNLNEKVQPDRTVAPSLDEVQNSKEHSNNGKDSSFEPYDDSDVLVQQLFDIRYHATPSKTTKSLNDQNSEFLITSTDIPF